jgi:hypothetical protein
MFEPYGRIVLLHMVLLIAAIPVLFLGQPLLGVLLLAILKTAVELNWWKLDVAPDQAKVRAALAEAMEKLKSRSSQ